MTSMMPIPGSVPIKNPMLNLFSVPPTDISMSSYRMVPISPFTTGINPVDFQIDPQEDYMDLSRSYFQLEWTLKKSDGNNAVATDKTYLVNNIAHSLFKQISVRLNGTLISPQTYTYHYKAYIETLLNFDRDDGETILKPQGWFNAINVPDTFQANELDQTKAEFKALDEEKQHVVKILQLENAKYAGKARILTFVPHIEVFQLSKLLIPRVKIGIQMYFNSPSLWYMKYAGAIAYRLNVEDIKIKLFLCQVRLDASIYRELMISMDRGDRVVSYPAVRSEIRTYNIMQNERHFEINNPFQNRLPNMVVIDLVDSLDFNEDAGKYPFSFKDYKLISIQQTVNGEVYPYRPLELDHANDSKDMRGYRQFLQATGSFCKSRGNMVRADNWGYGKNCTLFVYENAANGCLNSPIMKPQQTGEVRLIFDFGADQGANLTAIIYGEFENAMEINSNKTVQYDVYRT